MINPHNNRRLEIFHLIVACAFYTDFFLTGFMLSNYELMTCKDRENAYFMNHAILDGHDDDMPKYSNLMIKDFMSHNKVYFFIIVI